MKKDFTIKSSLKEIEPVIREISVYLMSEGVDPGILQDIKLVIEEAIINAVKHGNKFKENLRVMIGFECSKEKIRIYVQDEGKGYDYHRIPDPTLDENIDKESGRGVFLVKKLMDEVNFNRSGNRIEMVKYIN
jgi:serine/threonine-protein kinase RsbW